MQSADKKRKRNEPIDLFPPQDKEAKKIYNKVSFEFLLACLDPVHRGGSFIRCALGAK